MRTTLTKIPLRLCATKISGRDDYLMSAGFTFRAQVKLYIVFALLLQCYHEVTAMLRYILPVTCPEELRNHLGIVAPGHYSSL